MRTIYWSAGILLLAFAIPLAAETINPPTKPQVAPMTAQERKNLDNPRYGDRGTEGYAPVRPSGIG